MAESDQGNKPNVVGGSLKTNKLSFKTARIIILASVLVIVLGVVGTWLYRREASNNAQTGHCAKSNNEACTLLKQAVEQLDPSQSQYLESTVNQIKALKKDAYTKDVNLLYVVTTYYINIGDADNANTNLGLLKVVYKPKVGYDSVLGAAVSTPDQLNDNISAVKQSEADTRSNVFGVTPSGKSVRGGY